MGNNLKEGGTYLFTHSEQIYTPLASTFGSTLQPQFKVIVSCFTILRIAEKAICVQVGSTDPNESIFVIGNQTKDHWLLKTDFDLKYKFVEDITLRDEKEVDITIYDMPINNFVDMHADKMTVRLQNALMVMDYGKGGTSPEVFYFPTVGSITLKELRRLRNVGKKTIDELCEVFKELGLVLRA